MAGSYLERGDKSDIACALSILKEAAEVDPDATHELLEGAKAAAKKSKLPADSTPDSGKVKARVDALGEPPYLLLVGGDEGRRPHLASFEALRDEVGFDGEWIFTAAKPAQKSLAQIEETAEEGLDAILVHPRTTDDLRSRLREIAGELEIPLREVPWLGRNGIALEVLRTVDEACEACEAE